MSEYLQAIKEERAELKDAELSAALAEHIRFLLAVEDPREFAAGLRKVADALFGSPKARILDSEEGHSEDLPEQIAGYPPEQLLEQAKELQAKFRRRARVRLVMALLTAYLMDE